MVDQRMGKRGKLHIVSPPGSGKTVVGLEIIRKYGLPAVVFAPTSTIQYQWREQVKLFLGSEEPRTLNEIVSLDPREMKPINVYTYQLLSTTGEQLEFARNSALTRWKEQLLIDGIAKTENEAVLRIEEIEKNNPMAFKKELAKHYKYIKDRLLKDPTVDGTMFLHKNARDLIDRLVKSGIKVVVLDECHHLLDYWALIIKELIRRIDDPLVIGLTATLPALEDEEKVDNYITLLDGVDFEVPTPAVVKEGNLAPYKDLVYFCFPTKREMEFLKNVEARFFENVEKISLKPDFIAWVRKRAFERIQLDGTVMSWEDFIRDEAWLAIACIRFLKLRSQPIPKYLLILDDMNKPMTVDDWIVLLEDYGLRFLKLSSKPEHYEELKNIREGFKAFGITLTERGAKGQRSPGDLILSLSESKAKACVEILRAESEAMMEELRAVVITDFEKKSASVTKELSSVLDPDAGSAVKVLRTIVSDEATNKLDAVLVTGTSVLVDHDIADTLLEESKKWKERKDLEFELAKEDTGFENVVRLIGSGKSWKTSVYVDMITDFFEAGIIKCIVGTRGILGEGWDAISLNVLIDLTSTTTSTSVQQIRGRSIRLDPMNHWKLAHNWDVVCVAPTFLKGDKDLKRFKRKHSVFYGIDNFGQVVKGIYHVDNKLARRLGVLPYQLVPYTLYNAKMLNMVWKKLDTRKLWKLGDPYQNFETRATLIDKASFKFKSVYGLYDSLKKLWLGISASSLILVAFTMYLYIFMSDFLFSPLSVGKIIRIVLIVGIYLFVTTSIWILIFRYIKKAFIELPIDSCLHDISKVVLTSLQEAGYVSSSLSTDNIRVSERYDGSYQVHLDYSSNEDAKTFSKAFEEVLSRPTLSTRYIISRDEKSLSERFYSPAWFMLRSIFRLGLVRQVVFHPLPSVLSTNKEDASIFLRNWHRFMGNHGKLVYSFSDEGRKIVLKQMSKPFVGAKHSAFEFWS